MGTPEFADALDSLVALATSGTPGAEPVGPGPVAVLCAETLW